MRIAEIAPIALTVPPKDYGGIEWVVAHLAGGLSARGHDVTLFAAPGSASPARVVSTLDRPVGTGNVEAADELVHALAAYRHAADFDVIHDHTVLGVALGALQPSPVPVFHTLHGPWTPQVRRYYGALNGDVELVAISEAQRAENPGAHYAGVVYNGVRVASFPFREDDDGYLLFVGRVNREKGPDVAVEIARRAGLPLKMVVKRTEPGEQQYWEQQVAPRLTGSEEVLDGVGEAEKLRLYAGALATLFPIQWPEPFGLVMVESMACGTPVVARPCGAAREVVADGQTGFLRSEMDDLVAAVGQVRSLDPGACRARVEERFSSEAMVTGYEALFEAAGA
ncbi:MAG TPA: glycosyltransferase family 4 protein [Actinomycetota bacterium]|nr:glycosyltransferase family 4 protein [Actinomycetota bacterium]